MKRPPGVTIIAIVILLYGVLGTALSLFVLVLTVLYNTGKLPPEVVVVAGWSVFDVFLLAAQVALGVFALVSSIGLLRLRPWAWLMAMLLLGCELAIQLTNYFQGHPVYLLMLLTAILVLYLNRHSIREIFSIEPKTPAVPSSIYLEPASSASATEPQPHSASDQRERECGCWAPASARRRRRAETIRSSSHDPPLALRCGACHLPLCR